MRKIALCSDMVSVRGKRHPVRLLLGSDYAAQWKTVCHNGATATLPFVHCKSTRWPSEKQRALDEA